MTDICKPPGNRRVAGFTLVEMMVVIAIMLMAAIYFANFFINRLTYEEVRSVANEMMTLNRAITSFYSENYRWPGQVSLDTGVTTCSRENLFGELNTHFVDGYEDSIYLFDCGFGAKMEFAREVPNVEFAEILAGYLPSASVFPYDNKIYVKYIVIRPRLPMKVRFFEESADDEGILEIPFPDDCSNDRAAISVMPDRVCAPPPHASYPNIDNYNLLGGYKLIVKRINSSHCDDTRKRCWEIEVRARSDGASSDYETITSCPPEINEPITFRGMVFCNRD